MHMEKKQVTKEDGRFLTYYHFPETATSEETAAFEAVEGQVVSVTDPTQPSPAKPALEQNHV